MAVSVNKKSNLWSRRLFIGDMKAFIKFKEIKGGLSLLWIIGIAIGLITVIWLAMELATYEDQGKNVRSYFKMFKKSLLFVIPLFVAGGFIYYIFIR